MRYIASLIAVFGFAVHANACHFSQRHQHHVHAMVPVQAETVYEMRTVSVGNLRYATPIRSALGVMQANRACRIHQRQAARASQGN